MLGHISSLMLLQHPWKLMSLYLADAPSFNLEADIFQQPWQHCPVLTHLEAKAKPIPTIRLQQSLRRLWPLHRPLAEYKAKSKVEAILGRAYAPASVCLNRNRKQLGDLRR